MANLASLLRLPSNMKGAQWQILAGANTDPADTFHDGIAAAAIHSGSAIYL